MNLLKRLFLPGCARHIIQRGNNREAYFYGEADHKTYLGFLQEVSARYQVSMHAYVLMANRVHLPVTPDQCCPSGVCTTRPSSSGAAII